MKFYETYQLKIINCFMTQIQYLYPIISVRITQFTYYIIFIISVAILYPYFEWKLK